MNRSAPLRFQQQSDRKSVAAHKLLHTKQGGHDMLYERYEQYYAGK